MVLGWVNFTINQAVVCKQAYKGTRGYFASHVVDVDEEEQRTQHRSLRYPREDRRQVRLLPIHNNGHVPASKKSLYPGINWTSDSTRS